MEIIQNNENGKYVIDSKAIEDLAQIACLNVDGISFNKKESKKFVSCKSINNEIVLEVLVKLIKGCNVEEVCKNIQKAVYDKLYETTDIKINNININILGFEIEH